MGHSGQKDMKWRFFLFVLFYFVFFFFISKHFQNSLNQFENILTLLKFIQ